MSVIKTAGATATTILALAAAPAMAQYASDFETINASAAGTVLTGQDSYYIPAGTNSADFLAYTYSGNALGLPANPDGGAQFVAGVGPASPTFARAQRDIAWGTGMWVVSYDMAAFTQDQTLPVTNNIGSFSAQPYPGAATYIHLFSWTDLNVGDTWQAGYLGYNADGTAILQPGTFPGPEWQGLQLEKWYRFTTVIDFDSNQIVEASIEDLDTSTKTTAAVSGVYLEGGANGGTGTPTGFRFFGGGTEAGNGTAWDNASIEPMAAGLTVDIVGACPGAVTVDITGATPGGNVALVYGTNAGSFTNPNNPCQGITIDLRPPFLPGAPRTLRADANGNLSVPANLPSSVCNSLLLQVVDLATCEVSNLATK